MVLWLFSLSPLRISDIIHQLMNLSKIFTTRRLLVIFLVGAIVSLLYAWIFRPDGILGNLVAEFFGVFLGALIIDFFVIYLEEDRKLKSDLKQNLAVDLSLLKLQGTKGWFIFISPYTVKRISNVSLSLKFIEQRGEQETFLKNLEGSIGLGQLGNPIISDAELNKRISKCHREPDGIVLRWFDSKNDDRERFWSLDTIRSIQKAVDQISDKPVS